MAVRPDLELEMIVALQFYARPATHEVRFEEEPLPDKIHFKGEKARVVLAKLGITDH